MFLEINSTNHKTANNSYLIIIVIKNTIKGKFSGSFHEFSIIVMIKLETVPKNQRPILCTNVDIKILNKILAISAICKNTLLLSIVYLKNLGMV